MKLLSSLRYLVALDEQRHFARAAASCHITQPALSNALRALEDDFGVVIVRRGRSFQGFTPEGEEVLAMARRMLHEHKVLVESLSSTQSRPAGRVVIGAVPTAVPVAARFAALLQTRHPDIVPVVLSLSSTELEQRVERLTVDLALGYAERMHVHELGLTCLPQYQEHYFLLRRSSVPGATELQIGPSMRWAEAAREALCLLTPEMHNRTIVDQAFAAAGCSVSPAIETNSILTMVLSVLDGHVCSVLPGALLATVRAQRELEALPLVAPEVITAISFMAHGSARQSRAMEAALSLAQDAEWLRYAAARTGRLLDPPAPFTT